MRTGPLLSAAAAICCGLLAGCAHYTDNPLPDRAALAPGLAALHSDTPLPPRLGVEDVARLVLLNDPDLIAARRRHGVANAQLLQAGLLPNPQASLSATPTLAGPGTTTAWNAGVTQDLRSLILRPANRRAAAAGVKQVDAQVLWQEWQAAGQARLLSIQLIENARTLEKLGDLRATLHERYDARRAALRADNATYTALAPDAAALAGVDGQIRTAQQQQLSQHHALAALLGLVPDAVIPLADSPEPAPFSPETIRAALPLLPDRRPDLLALRYGYEAQNQTLHGAILQQFPNVSFGLTGGSDNSNVRALGPQINLELPIFDHGQGAIAIARSTRAQLHDEYAARLSAADGEIRARLSELAQIDSQLATARAALPDARAAAQAAADPHVVGLIDPQARVDLLSAWITRELDVIGLDEARLSQIVAIETLAGTGLPSVHSFDKAP